MTRSLSTPAAAFGEGLDPEVGEPAGSAAAGGNGLDPEAGERVGSAAGVGSLAAGSVTRSALVQAGRLSSRPISATRVVRTLPRASLVAVVVKDGFFQEVSGPTEVRGGRSWVV